MGGLDRHTGREISGGAHLAQSVLDILTTPVGTLVMRRDYGSRLPELLDQPFNGETMMDIMQATAEALALWEPRIDLVRVEVAAARPGRLELDLTDASGRLIPVVVS